ncbi:4a-hydroxytetrahydrobiopterin dehydratase [Sulfolobus acidocaldarius]|uniref:Putative pterin-4-alpha-carbinolamine dehydratase n=4 Tax=Sulfolobus acidocaldarius TaxID=2285 RepID=PHS_SULAC|nr:4a-hydroxytetrahydrobiopterin dehydratase [Sulfolobus acidocaldarius]Q4J6J6.1 RecName: Full=Putative pterin-4-alpha-carbinolamine dehydratase; Short=PHS; AltName: Full=4-alpha-hydroxy-tetrahydropterin dehydratase; AltName: Full=Pterin carbinolamine dehydratase; Short=PCD [Sulfolobus acidocaldarius DSM 639]AAY81585.1 pterin 4 alpha carbinolamine dehydratase [Sulfolobus acidocaldarius DSM 639]AGE72187.1 pterin-4-alpha-carbinolamine dehydratase [Sulfolobus acidocaldarius N8]AGE74505.1 pterin-4-
MKLDENEIKRRLGEIEGWSYENNKLKKTFKFKNFYESVEFVRKIQPIADEMDHHPDLCVYYNRVVLELSTHSEGGVTEKDFELAKKINKIQ